ncbi:hypothetical protein ACEWY4_027363 [Coilia grayii]|uniref:SWIM-type domain-containing protein n=1 Tax=Coilia grayii TaxID=363190 RepID=A0ABD1ITB1_9TELE
MHSQRLSQPPLTPWVILAPSGEVVSAHCTCMAGVAESCTHVGALLFKVEASVRLKEQATVTDEPAYWMLPGNINKVHPEVGHKIDFTSAAAKRQSLNSAIDGESHSRPAFRTCATKATTLTPTPTSEDMDKLYSDIHRTGTRAVVLSVTPRYCNEYRDPTLPIRDLKSLANLHGRTLDTSDFSALRQHCQTLEGIANITHIQAAQIEQRTKGQLTSSLWFAARAGRITASSMHSVYATDIHSPALSTVKRVCYPQHGPVTPATTWGVKQEERARQEYISRTNPKHHNQEVQTCGFFVNPAFPQVGASPDAIVECTCCGKGCIEIKCPAKYKDSTILDACSSNDSSFPLYQANGRMHLKKSHPYYSQVQTQMFVTERMYCDFVVWTQKDCAILRIFKDTAFWEPRLQKAQEFFVEVCLPELVAKHFTKPPTSQTSASCSGACGHSSR